MIDINQLNKEVENQIPLADFVKFDGEKLVYEFSIGYKFDNNSNTRLGFNLEIPLSRSKYFCNKETPLFRTINVLDFKEYIDSNVKYFTTK